MNTETPPAPLSNIEAVQILTDGRLIASLTPRQKDAVLRAVHLVWRRSAQKERNERNRRSRGVYFTPPFVEPTPAPLSPDAPPCAPARNCDRPECADVEGAWATYCAETNRADCKGFARWLFAPAEGGAE